MIEHCIDIDTSKDHTYRYGSRREDCQGQKAMSGVRYAMIIHRTMGCADESATDEEQAEKILYFNPSGECFFGDCKIRSKLDMTILSI